MSAIAKPHLFFAGASTTAQQEIVIPVDWIFSMDKANIATSATNATLEYFIIITYVPVSSGNVRVDKIKFPSLVVRDFSFTAAKSLIGASIAGS